MSNNYDDFKRSLDALVNQAQATARLGVEVARDQVETVIRNPNLSNLNTGNLNDQMDEVRRNLQTMAREMETRAQDLVHLATTYMNNRPAGFGGSAPSGSGAANKGATTEPPTGAEAATAAGAGTAQDAGSHTEATQTNMGEGPQQ